jgi:hypothetical protein
MPTSDRIDPKRTRIKVTEILDHVGYEICQNYCKYPEQYKDEKTGEELETKLYEEHCKNCPLGLI